MHSIGYGNARPGWGPHEDCRGHPHPALVHFAYSRHPPRKGEGGTYQLIARIRSLIFSACGPSSFDSLSSRGSATATKPDLSTSVTTLTPIDRSLSCDSCSSLSALAGWVRLTSSAAACTQPCCSGVRLFQSLSLIQTRELLASCSVIESTGATS